MPNLVVEVGASSLEDDLGRKRLMYEQIGIEEYWVVDVDAKELIAFAIDGDGRSGRIWQSVVLPGLKTSLVDEALRRSQTENDGAIAWWLMKVFS